MLMQKRSDSRTACSVRELRSKQTSASGGSSESDVRAFAVAPAGPSSPCAVITLTPVAQKPIRHRYSAEFTGRSYSALISVSDIRVLTARERLP